MKTMHFACILLVSMLALRTSAKLVDDIKNLRAPSWHHERVFVPSHQRRIGEAANETLGEHPLSGGGTTAYISNISAFWIGKYEVSVARFAEFAKEVESITEAEAEQSSSVTLHRCLFGMTNTEQSESYLRDSDSEQFQVNVTGTKAMVVRQNATWWAPAGKPLPKKRKLCARAREECCKQRDTCRPDQYSCSIIDSVCPSATEQFGSMPVTHVTRPEAELFCDWDGGVLPSEEQWEAAAGGTLQGSRFPWGDTLTSNGTHRANLWQGMWPRSNAVRDGYRFVAPINAYGPQNEWDVYNIIGNVAEHTSTPFCNATSQALRSTPNTKSCARILSEVGVMSDAMQRDSANNLYAHIPMDVAYKDTSIIKGGSYMSHVTSDALFRIGGRGRVYDNTTRDTLGFRCAYTTPHLRGLDGHSLPDTVPGFAPSAPTPARFTPLPEPRVAVEVPDDAAGAASAKTVSEKVKHANEESPEVCEAAEKQEL